MKILRFTIRFTLIIIAISLLFSVTACSETPNQLRERAKVKLLEDFDCLVAEIEANMPLSGAINRKLDMDLATEFAQIREYIAEENHHYGADAKNMEQMEKRAADFLFTALSKRIERKLGGMGHLFPLSREMYIDIFTDLKKSIAEEAGYLDSQKMYETFSHPAALRFYSVDESALDLKLEDENIGLFTRKDPKAVQTQIYSPGEIAWITINHSLNNLDFDREILLPFFEEIQNYPHLVIDMRNHQGGNTNHFYELIMTPLLAAPVYVNGVMFVTGGECAQTYLGYYKTKKETDDTLGYQFYDAYQYVNLRNMTKFAPQDLENLTHAMEWSNRIEPMDNAFPFAGEIWILTSQKTASAGEDAVMSAMSSSFATVVGEPTAGIIASMASHVVLPNTGIVFRMDINYFTDAQGRSLVEFGISPDIFNRPGLDAEQTVLELIAEET